MPQSLTQLPKTVKCEIGRLIVIINDHAVSGDKGFLNIIMVIISDSTSHRDILADFEKYGISFEMVIEACVRDLEDHTMPLAHLIYWHYSSKNTMKVLKDKKRYRMILAFSESAAGKVVAEQIIEKIRSCDDWQELRDELHLQSEFQKGMRKKLKKKIREMTRRCLRV